MAEKKNAPKIAIPGWGSLIWDKRPEFDKHHEQWLQDGPVLKLEFSRISESRKDALTLVIDGVNGSECKTSYASLPKMPPVRSRPHTDRLTCLCG